MVDSSPTTLDGFSSPHARSILRGREFDAETSATAWRREGRRDGDRMKALDRRDAWYSLPRSLLTDDNPLVRLVTWVINNNTQRLDASTNDNY